ncbi:MAG: hypothetical protein JWL81_3019 [Verrucomicrobiales bacterium]|nr:hypothetical protein [Verrucomicrobiales bacterium]
MENPCLYAGTIMKRLIRFLPLALALTTSLPGTASAVTLVMDYSKDTSGFFAPASDARTSLEQAATDLSNVLANGQLGALSNNVITGTASGTNAIATWNLGFTNPSNGGAETLSNPDAVPGFAADEIRIYVGWRNLTGSVLGQGGPGSAGASLGGGGSPSNWIAAVNAMDTASDVMMNRGGGPIIGTLNGNLTLGATTATYSLEFGSFVGNLWFDSDTDNDSITDSSGTLNSFWNLDLGLPSGGQSDLYSVALHELMHAIGFGTSQSWTSLPADPNISGGHLSTGVTGLRITDNVSQEAVMTPTITVGTRKSLTTTDLQYLGAIGFDVIPEPGTTALLGLLGLGLLRRRSR